ncbi:hypothetical protein P4E94_00820 [Pontiellaceae bacterium B12219]|nr:hypothetical protein [Pontiellaceae bacterium B12219]
MRKVMILWVGVLCISAAVQASRTDEVTLVMVPRNDDAVRVGMDIATRYPTLLISYKLLPNNSASLHGWNGKEWVNITLEDFHEGNFFRTGPDSALIVEEEGISVPELVIPPAGWCTSAYKITTDEVRPMLHLFGQYYDFSYKDWKWFSENYRMSMAAINPENLNVSWYHKRLGDNLKSGPLAADDLQYWVAIRHPVTITEAVVVETEEVVEEEPVMELPDDPEVNPFAQAAPEAVVLGAGDAEESHLPVQDIPVKP